MIKFTIILRRKPEMTHEQFVAYHRDQHAPLFGSLPEVQQHVRRYVQVHAVPESVPGMPDSKIDGTTELWFDDIAGLAAVFTAPRYMEIIRRTRQSSSICTPANSSSDREPGTRRRLRQADIIGGLC